MLTRRRKGPLGPLMAVLLAYGGVATAPPAVTTTAVVGTMSVPITAASTTTFTVGMSQVGVTGGSLLLAGSVFPGCTPVGNCDLPLETYLRMVKMSITNDGSTTVWIDPVTRKYVRVENNKTPMDVVGEECPCDDSATPLVTYYRDYDKDGYGDKNVPTVPTCHGAPAGYVIDNTDCDDSDPLTYPGAPEICDQKDNDCNGVWEGEENDQNRTYYQDYDEDTHGDLTHSTSACGAPKGYVISSDDCDDTKDTVHPGAPEVCDGLDNDCDGMKDEVPTDGTDYYPDLDGDGYGMTGAPASPACSQPPGYVTDHTDCDDNPETGANTYPGASEICDGLDNNCNGQVDENAETVTWYQDTDGDTYGTSETTQESCEPVEGFSTRDGDCDDTNGKISPAAPEICNSIDDNCNGEIDENPIAPEGTVYSKDADGDTWGDPSTSTRSCSTTPPEGYVANGRDCDDANNTIYPGAEEFCNSVDDNCNGQIDENPVDGKTYAQDADSDGYGSPLTGDMVQACSAPAGYVDIGIPDCDDNREDVHPEGTEVCDGVDDNCNGQVDEDTSTDATTWYQDDDGDGYGISTPTVVSCSRPDGYATQAGDCLDTDPKINPGATEVCDGVDNNCDEQIDENTVASVLYFDEDSDGYGGDETGIVGCATTPGIVAVGGDCQDFNPTINPGATEVCDGVDNNCDEQIDDSSSSNATVWYADTDGDGYGNPNQTAKACSAPVDYVADHTDCDDTNATINPGATEVCNEVDDNCDQLVDIGGDVDLKTTLYRDADGDGYGNASQSVKNCYELPGYVADNTDCDDANATTHPNAPELCDGVDNNCNGQIDDNVDQNANWYRDADGDGYGIRSDQKTDCSQPSGYAAQYGDCDDANPKVNPGATEACDEIDNDCDGKVDDADIGVTGQGIWYRDTDVDGYGVLSEVLAYCSQPNGYATKTGDCDDTNAGIYPGATEVCNSLDDNCNGQVDEGVKTTYYRDADGDGFGAVSATTTTCSAPSGYVTDNTDCDDTRASVNPGATETCNSLDDNCNGQVDEGVGPKTYYVDSDGDGYGNVVVSTTTCTQPTGYVTDNTDCNDNLNTTHPGASELCDGVDNNCDGQVDNGVVSVTWYRDADGDGYGSGSSTTQACSQPTGYATTNTDCDDTNTTINPGATEICNFVDENCNGQIDEGVKNTYYLDNDGDGYGSASTGEACTQPNGFVSNNFDCDDTRASVNPNMTEVCNSLDDNCDSVVDEGVGTTYYRDADGDGYGTSVTTQACSKPAGYAATNGDCDDSKASVNPKATETCNSLDDNCDGQVDEGVKNTYYQDTDKDGYGNASQTAKACSQPTGYVSNSTDCNDTNASIHPNAAETCNGLDDNCNGSIDEGVKTTYYRDADGDGYGSSTSTTQACTVPTGYVSNSTDCNDTSNAAHPGGVEVEIVNGAIVNKCNDGLDNDCNGATDKADDACNDKVDGDGIPDGIDPIFAVDTNGNGVADTIYVASWAMSDPYDGYDAVCQGLQCGDKYTTINTAYTTPVISMTWGNLTGLYWKRSFIGSATANGSYRYVSSRSAADSGKSVNATSCGDWVTTTPILNQVCGATNDLFCRVDASSDGCKGVDYAIGVKITSNGVAPNPS